MTTQTTYTEQMKEPRPGTMKSRDDTITGLCETVAGIGFGLAVSQGANSDQGTILGGTLAGYKGVSAKDITMLVSNADKYLPPNNMAICDKGEIWAEPGEAVNANDPVYFNGATGVLMKSAAGGALGPIPGAYWGSSCGIGGRAYAVLGGIRKNGIT
jgi:hypothetical protein